MGDLDAACRHNASPERLAALIDAKADVHARSGHLCQTPLIVAALCERPDAMAVFIARGADLYARDTHNQTPGNLAIISCNIEVLGVLIAAGFDINRSRNCQNMTLIHAACWFGSERTFERLILAGVDACAFERARPVWMPDISDRHPIVLKAHRDATAWVQTLRRLNGHMLPGPAEWSTGELGLPRAAVQEVVSWLEGIRLKTD